MKQHCSKCKAPRLPRTTLCRAHKSEAERERRAVKRDQLDLPRTILVPKAPGDRMALVKDLAERKLIEPKQARELLDARPTAPGGERPYEQPALARVLFIPDVHRPYHDKRAWATMIKAAKLFRPDKIVVLGDYGDCYAASSFVKDPRRKNDLKWEAEDCNVGLDELDALEATHKIFIAGNHEDRLERYLSSAAPSLIGVTSIPELYRLAERGWHYTPYKRSTRLGKVRLTHDTGTAGINAHRQSVDAFQASCIIGHTHRMEMSYKGNADGKPTVGAMFGWLGDFDQIDYMQAVKARRDWVHGFGIGFEEPNGVIHLQCVPIIEGRCVMHGQLVTL